MMGNDVSGQIKILIGKDLPLKERTLAAFELGKSHNKKAIDPLFDCLISKDSNLNERFRDYVRAALLNLSKEGSIKQILEKMKNENTNLNPFQRTEIIKVLQMSKNPEVIDALIDSMLNHKGSRKIAQMALESYGEIIVEPMISTLIDEKNDFFSFYTWNHESLPLVLMLFERFQEKSLLVLERKIYDNTPNIRKKICIILGFIYDEKSINLLICTFGDADNEVRDASVHSIKKFLKIDPIWKITIDCLLNRINEKNSTIREKISTLLNDFLNNPIPQFSDLHPYPIRFVDTEPNLDYYKYREKIKDKLSVNKKNINSLEYFGGKCIDVFSDIKNDYKDIYYLFEYYPKYLQYSKRRQNQAHDFNSAKILALKDRKYRGGYSFNGEFISQLEALDYFFRYLPKINQGIPVMVIPPSNPENFNSGMNKLVRMLGVTGCIDATDCIIRSEGIKRFFSKDIQNKIPYQESLQIQKYEKFKNKNVLLLDDVTTTEHSFIWVKELLRRNGAKNVACLALGKTTR